MSLCERIWCGCGACLIHLRVLAGLSGLLCRSLLLLLFLHREARSCVHGPIHEEEAIPKVVNANQTMANPVRLRCKVLWMEQCSEYHDVSGHDGDWAAQPDIEGLIEVLLNARVQYAHLRGREKRIVNPAGDAHERNDRKVQHRTPREAYADEADSMRWEMMDPLRPCREGK